jgi:hypothetical protein
MDINFERKYTVGEEFAEFQFEQMPDLLENTLFLLGGKRQVEVQEHVICFKKWFLPSHVSSETVATVIEQIHLLQK